MSTLKRFENFDINENEIQQAKPAASKSIAPADQKIVDDYVDKFERKMSGSSKGVAAGWIDGIGDVDDNIKRAIWISIQQDINHKLVDNTELPNWINESASPKPGDRGKEWSSSVDDFKEAVTKLFMEYDKTKFKHQETKEILDWLQDSTTIKFFEKLLKEK